MARSGKRGRVVYLLLGLLTIANAGCLAVATGAAVAAGGGAYYMYTKGNVAQEYPSSFNDTWQAVETAMKDLQLPIDNHENNGTGGKITSHTRDNSTVVIELETRAGSLPVDGSVTRVGVRVGTFGDQALSERVLSQVSSHLVQANVWRPAPGAAPVAPGAPATASTIKPVPAMPSPQPPIRPVSATTVGETGEPPLSEKTGPVKK